MQQLQWCSWMLSLLLRSHLTLIIEGLSSLLSRQSRSYPRQSRSLKPSSASELMFVLMSSNVLVWLTVNGLRVKGKCCVQGQTVHSHLSTLNAIPVVPQRGCAIELVMKTRSGAVVHTDQDIIQSPLGRVFPYRDGEREAKMKNKWKQWLQNDMVIQCFL